MAATNLVACSPRGEDNCPRKLKLTTPSSKMGSTISAKYSHSLGMSTMKSSALRRISLKLQRKMALQSNNYRLKYVLTHQKCHWHWIVSFWSFLWRDCRFHGVLFCFVPEHAWRTDWRTEQQLTDAAILLSRGKRSKTNQVKIVFSSIMFGVSNLYTFVRKEFAQDRISFSLDFVVADWSLSL